MFFKQLKRDTLSEGRGNKKRKVEAAEEVAVDDDLAVTLLTFAAVQCLQGLVIQLGKVHPQV